MTQGPSQIARFDQSQCDRAPLPPHHFYWRWNLTVGDGKFHVSDAITCRERTNDILDCQGLHSTCTQRCSGLYNPSVHIQRYCQTCCEWYHVSCLDKADGIPSSVVLGLANASEDAPIELLNLAVRPIERGSALGVVGNGQAQLTARRLLCEGTQDEMDQWKLTIGSGYIATMRQLQPAYFRCTRCTNWL
jgi:hypothetical protein